MYSSDTAPVESLIRLAKGADILIHEAAGASEGHTSAEQAGEIAAKCDVGELYLIHYPTEDFDFQKLVTEAKRSFAGPVRIALDFQELDF